MIQDKIFFDEKDPTGVSYNTPFTVYGSYQGRLWSKTPSGTIKYYTQNSDLSVYATTGSNSFNGNQTVTGSFTVVTGSAVELQVTNLGVNIGSVLTDNHNVTGSLRITGSLTVTTTGTELQVTNTGVNLGNIVTDNHNVTGSLRVSGSMVVTGSGTFTSNVAATSGIFINGGNQNILGSGALSLLNYSSYNSSANQNVILGLGLNDAVDNNIAYQYNLSVGGNASGQNLSLTSKRNNTTDLTILSINGTTGAATFATSIATNVANSFKISSGPYNAVFHNDSTSTSDYNAIRVTQGAVGSATGYIGTGGSTVGNASFQNTFVIGTQSGNALVLNTNDAERVRIASGGSVTISNLSTGAVYSNSGTLTNTAPLITATGGTITTSGSFKYHTFTSSGTFQVTAGSGLVEVFVLGGGGAGGGDFSGATFYGGGGGGGGGLYNPAYYVEVSSYTVTVGAGGTPNALSNGYGGDGSNSVFGNITALGGGGGSRGNSDSSTTFVGRDGGSGGGGGSSNGVGGIAIQAISNGVAYGNNGGTGAGIGGAGGGIGTQPTTGFGGLGRYIFNLANRIGGGGGAGTFTNSGGNGRDGGGNGGYWNGSNDSNSGGTAGTANTGGGGGGLGYPTGLGGAGGSGIVIVRYKV